MEYTVTLNKNDITTHKVNRIKLHFIAILIVVELVLGGAGRVIMLGALTARYILFLLAILYFVFKVIRNNFKVEKNIFHIPVVVFFFFYLISIMNGMIRGYPISDIVFSSQGYLYLLMFFPFTLFINTTEKAKIALHIFNKAAFFLALFSIGIFVAFSARPSLYSVINPLLMNLEYGHLSMRYGLPSVFFKTSPYMAIAFIHELYKYVSLSNERTFFSIIRMFILLVGCLTTMTMGIWVSLVFGILVVISFSNGSKKLAALLLTIVVGIAVTLIFSEFLSSALVNRISRTDSSYIIKSNQLLTMINVWFENMLFGKGFGVRILFISEIATREMAKFELFWLELLVNMGILGFISYVYIILKNLFVGLKSCRKLNLREATHVKSIIIGLLMLCIISSMNPFLNNPIGLGYLVIVMTSINAFYKKSIAS